MTDNLHIFALSQPDATRHTHLTRSKDKATVLPPLAEWLGVETLDADKVELFPVEDLGGMPLSSYVATAFDVDSAALGGVGAKLDALTGSVLLVPSHAIDTRPAPGPQVELVASLPQLHADHGGALPRADVSRPAPPPERARHTGPQPTGIVPIALALAVVVALAIWWFTT